MIISNYSTFDFLISFNIPANSIFTSVVINDVLANGLSYTIGNAQLSINDGTTPITSGYTDTSSIDPTTNISTITITITNSEVIEPSVDTIVNIKIPVIVTNINALLTEQANDPNLKNVASIAAYINGSSISEIPAETSMNFTEFNLYGFGSADSADRRAGVNLTLISSIVVTDSSANPNLYYEYTLTAAEGISFLEDPSAIMVLSQNNNTPINFTIETLTDSFVKLYFNQVDFIRRFPVYFIIPAVTNENILNVPSTVNQINNNAAARLVYALNTPEEAVIDIAEPFTVTINLNTAVPQLSNASKVILNN